MTILLIVIGAYKPISIINPSLELDANRADMNDSDAGHRQLFALALDLWAELELHLRRLTLSSINHSPARNRICRFSRS
jgi:hypothetical protein